MRYAGCALAISLIVMTAASRVDQAASPTLTVLHAFNGLDGLYPEAPLVQASDGNFYGTTYSGGDDGNGCAQGCDGTVFKITPQGDFTLLHTFTAGGGATPYADGRNPSGGLVEGPDGNLYGTTFNGGVGGHYGVFYRISKTGQFQNLHQFCGGNPCTEGTNPQGSLVLGRDGYFYGTTTAPVAYPQVFRITTSGVYTTIKNLYNTGLGTPQNGLVQATDGNFYGVAVGGIYRVTPAPGFSILYLFSSGTDGSGNSELTQAADGDLYGATYPGPGNSGSVFRITLGGIFQRLAGFTTAVTGNTPNALLQTPDGNLWGANYNGGTSAGGTFYSITTGGAFLDTIPLSTTTTGVRPIAPLIQGTDGRLYGTTSSYGLLNGKPAGGTIVVIDAGLAPPQPRADLVASKSASPDPALAGGTLTYTIGVSNNGPSVATGVTIADPLPAGLTFVSATSSQGSCQFNGTVTCNIGTLTNAATATATVTVQPTTSGTLTNQASVSANEVDPDASNNSATAMTTVNPAADLGVSMFGAPDPVALSAPVTFTIVVSNNGPSTATNVTLTDPLPSGATYVSSSSTAGSCAVAKGKAAALTCAIGALDPGASTTVSLVLDAPRKAGTITNTASVAATESDPNPANNSALSVVSVGGAADLSVAKSASANPVAVGSPLTYTMVATNAGPSIPTDVTLTDPLPKNVTYVSSSTTQGLCTTSKAKGGVTLTCGLGSLANGASATVTLLVTPTAAGVVSNTATVSSSVRDPNTANNSATVSVTVR